MIQTIEEALAQLKELGACPDALEWVATQPDAATAWQRCSTSTWMNWLLIKTRAEVDYSFLWKGISVVKKDICTPQLLAAVEQWEQTGEYICPERPFVGLEYLIDNLLRNPSQMSHSAFRKFIGSMELCNMLRSRYPTWPERSEYDN